LRAHHRFLRFVEAVLRLLERTVQQLVFIERLLELRDGREVVVRFLLPEQRETDWSCTYRIAWPDRQREFVGYGIDGVQALSCAMMNAHAELLASPEAKAGDLLWLGERDLGLPLAGNLTPDDFE
jgi:hypothetical protein